MISSTSNVLINALRLRFNLIEMCLEIFQKFFFLFLFCANQFLRFSIFQKEKNVYSALV